MILNTPYKMKNDQLEPPPGTPRKLFPSRKTYAFAYKNRFLKSFRGVPFFPAYKIDMAKCLKID